MKTIVDTYGVSPRTSAPQPTIAIVSRSRRRRASAVRQSSVVFDGYADDLFRLASVLSDNAEFAQHLVIQAIVSDQFSGPAPQHAHELSASLVRAWVNRDRSAWAADNADRSDLSPRSAILGDLHTLDDEHRAVLTLCKFGAHTYREAAHVLHLSAERAATLLCEAMHQLQVRVNSRD